MMRECVVLVFVFLAIVSYLFINRSPQSALSPISIYICKQK
jgi:hypothetical protein